uniref:Brix domain-containing protein n=1 Tax=Gopherus evgoodei TaxID=1825980 RepID=A0A8C4WR85_9SAUR
QLRREARLRREYLYRRAQEDRIRATRPRRSNSENRLLPPELRREALALQRSIEFDDQGAEGLVTQQDDEYRWAGVEDPKVMITTSRDPSSRLKMFAKEMKLVLPGRPAHESGRHEVGALLQACKANGVTDLLVLHEHAGSRVSRGVLRADRSHLPFGPTAFFTLCNVVMRHEVPDIGTMSEGHASRLCPQVCSILKYLFPVPKEDSKRVITFANQDDYISFRCQACPILDHRNIEPSEVGPRFEMKRESRLWGPRMKT